MKNWQKEVWKIWRLLINYNFKIYKNKVILSIYFNIFLIILLYFLFLKKFFSKFLDREKLELFSIGNFIKYYCLYKITIRTYF